MGQPPSNHVTLQNVGVAGGTDWSRIGPDGLPVGPGPFRVPAGQV